MTDIYTYIQPPPLHKHIYILNGHRNTRHTKTHVHHVGSDPQWALGQYVILTAKAPKLIHHKMEYPGIPALPTVT
jgi:hypothetical protein